ncbi:MAG: DUF5658 family protein [Vicinamibacterales bacterium]
MVRKMVVAAALVLLAGVSTTASAQTLNISNQTEHPHAFTLPTFGDVQAAPSEDIWRVSNKTIPDGALTSMFVATALVQALDFHSSQQAFRAGGVEANPVMRHLTANPYVFAATKGAVAASTILLTREIAKHNRLAAMLTLTAINSAYAMVVRNNYQIAGVR